MLTAVYLDKRKLWNIQKLRRYRIFDMGAFLLLKFTGMSNHGSLHTDLLSIPAINLSHNRSFHYVCFFDRPNFCVNAFGHSYFQKISRGRQEDIPKAHLNYESVQFFIKLYS